VAILDAAYALCGSESVARQHPSLHRDVVDAGVDAGAAGAHRGSDIKRACFARWNVPEW
jgi:hypothetical protein